jgi:hypothetical protein
LSAADSAAILISFYIKDIERLSIDGYIALYKMGSLKEKAYLYVILGIKREKFFICASVLNAA